MILDKATAKFMKFGRRLPLGTKHKAMLIIGLSLSIAFYTYQTGLLPFPSEGKMVVIVVDTPGSWDASLFPNWVNQNTTLPVRVVVRVHDNLGYTYEEFVLPANTAFAVSWYIYPEGVFIYGDIRLDPIGVDTDYLVEETSITIPQDTGREASMIVALGISLLSFGSQYTASGNMHPHFRPLAVT